MPDFTELPVLCPLWAIYGRYASFALIAREDSFFF
jgi:hypothetical protein